MNWHTFLTCMDYEREQLMLANSMENPKVSAFYRSRGLPCNCVPDDDLWAVSGSYDSRQGAWAGILEWCTSKEDAQRMLAHMNRYAGFSNLRAHKWASP